MTNTIQYGASRGERKVEKGDEYLRIARIQTEVSRVCAYRLIRPSGSNPYVLFFRVFVAKFSRCRYHSMTLTPIPTYIGIDS